MKYTALVFFTLFFSFASFAQQSIKGKALFGHIRYLSSDALKGRWPGSEGDSLAEKHIINFFKKSGIMPLLPRYIQPFDITVKMDALPSDNFIVSAGKDSLALNRQYGIYPFSGQGQVDAPVLAGKDNDAVFLAQKHIRPSWMVLW